MERILDQNVSTDHGDFTLYCYEDHVNRNVHLAMVMGDPGGDEPPLVRVHVQDSLGDLMGIKDASLSWPLREAMARIAAAGNGILVVLRFGDSPRQIIDAVRNLSGAMSREPVDDHAGHKLRTYGTGSQILRDLGVTRMRVLSAPKQMQAISGFGLEVVEFVDKQSETDS